VNIRQEKGESLRMFMERFNRGTLNIQNPSLNVALHHMVIALRPESFADSLCKKLTSNLDELRQRAAKFMQLEYLREYKNQARPRQAVIRGMRRRKSDLVDPIMVGMTNTKRIVAID